ncbi:uncharacterized protein LOC135842396 [Planococcus citri]|uniref:uncharacterized protein LOC135842396 n=1 Tax=Planococcus citri TaxID=170843 RepID=UPI0031FA01D9
MSLLSITFLILSTCVVSNVCDLLCFECNSVYDGIACEQGNNLNGLSDFTRPCVGRNANYIEEYEKPLCRKVEQRIKTRNNMKIIKRSCGYELYQKKDEDLCYTYRTEDHEEIVCQCFGNHCNGADIKTSSFYWNVVCSLLVIFWYFK